MNCDKHVFNVHWAQHHWVRHVSATDSYASCEADMWGRQVENEQVTCHITYVCRECGTTRDGGECSCDKTRGDRCAPRRACLDTVQKAPAVEALTYTTSGPAS